jgi:transcriptional regulator with XRE-family HTH domain
MNNLAVARYIKSLMMRHRLSQKQAAQEIGYSQTYVTQHLRLLSLPYFFKDLTIRIPDYSAVYRLAKLYERKPEAVQNWIRENPKCSNRDIRVFLREFATPRQMVEPSQSYEFPYHIVVKHGQSEAVVLMNRKPAAAEGTVWIRLKKSGTIREVEIARVKPLRFDKKISTRS